MDKIRLEQNLESAQLERNSVGPKIRHALDNLETELTKALNPDQFLVPPKEEEKTD